MYFTFDILYDFTFLATITLKSDWLAVVTIINQAISHMFHFYLWDACRPRRDMARSQPHDQEQQA